MKQCIKCHQIKVLAEFHKDKGKSDGLCRYCKVCNRAHVLNWQKTPVGKAKHHAVAQAWQSSPKNKDKHAKSVDRWQKTPRGKIKLLAQAAKYRAFKIQATPTWLTKSHLEEIESFYTLAKELQWLSDETLEVDHIVPLVGDTVCGLHVPWNLQILSASLNRKKSNKLIQL